MNVLKRRPVKIGLGIFALWVVAVAVLVGWGTTQALEGRKHLTSAQENISADSMRSGALEEDLGQAHETLASANAKISNPIVQPVRIIPLVGTQVTSAMRVTGAAADASEIAADTLGQVRELDAGDEGSRSKQLEKIAAICNEGSRRLAGIDLGPRSGLIGPLSDARATGDEQVRSMTNALVRGGAAADGLSTLLGEEESNYLLLAANNGEMRNGSGMFLQVGMLRAGNDELTVTDTQSVAEVAAPEAAISWPQDLQANWDWLGERGDLRDLMLSPRFDVNAPLAKEIWEHGGRPKVAGVIALDIPMLESLLAVTGPVTANGTEYSSDNVQQALLFQQYIGTDDLAVNNERREGLSDVASAVFTQFASGDWSPAAGARELGRAADGRHILVWSADNELNDKWVSAGVNGTVLANDTMVSAINLGTNKLDQFLEIESDLEIENSDSATGSILRMTVSNTAPENAPEYILGEGEMTGIPPATYNGLLTITLPPDVTNTRFDGELPLSVAGRDGLSQVVATGINVPRGNTQEIVLRFDRPESAQGTRILPSARVPAVDWSYRDETFSDETPRQITY
jgi:hypothetical protein